MGFKFNPISFSGFDITDAGGSSWGFPVATEGSLPATGSVDGEARVVLDTDTIYIWDLTTTQWIRQDFSISTFSASGDAAGLSLSSNDKGNNVTDQLLVMHPATATQPGGVSIIAQNFAGNKTFDNNVTVTGDLTVSGTTTTINTANLTVEDKNITINFGGNDATSEGAGLTVERVGTDGSLVYEDALASKFKLGALAAESEILTAGHVQTITANKTMSGVLNMSALTLSTVLKLDASNNVVSSLIVNADVAVAAAIDATKIADGTVTNAEFQYINTLTSNAQDQIDGKANLALDNLAAVAINTSLISDTASTDSLGSAAIPWLETHSDKVFAGGNASSWVTTPILSVVGNTEFEALEFVVRNDSVSDYYYEFYADNGGSIATDMTGSISVSQSRWLATSSFTGGKSAGILTLSNVTEGYVKIHSGNGASPTDNEIKINEVLINIRGGSSSAANATATQPISINTGAKSAGTGDSGAIDITTGTSLGGARGVITLDSEADAVVLATQPTGGTALAIATTDYVDNAPHASLALDNLASTAVNVSIIPNALNTIDLGTLALSYRTVYTEDIQMQNGSGELIGRVHNNSGTSIQVQSMNKTAGTQTKAVQLFTGNQTGTAFSGAILLDTGDASGNSSGSATLSTGTGTTGTGTISILSGNASAGNSGPITIQTGTASGTRGVITLNTSADLTRLTAQPTGGTALAVATTQYVDDLLSVGDILETEGTFAESSTNNTIFTLHASVRSAKIYISLYIDATADQVEMYEVNYITDGAAYEDYTVTSNGNSDVTIDVSSRLVRYASTTYAGFAAGTSKFKYRVISTTI
tara:strand:- start:930 stop:3392 length:2463 start_codon:yes stop_codon:yes gene_type:complete